jgi:hypothetical protein
MQHKNLFLIILTLTVLCCKKTAKEVGSFDIFLKTQNYHSNAIEIPACVGNLSEIIILNDVFVVLDDKGVYFLHVFNENKSKYIGSFIKHGRGPKEEVLINSIQRKEKNRFYYQTLTGIKLVEFMPDSINLGEINKYNSSIDDLTVFFSLDSNLYGWNDRSSLKKEFIGFNIKDYSCFDFGPDFPNQKSKFLSSEDKSRLYGNKRITVKPDGSLFASVYMNFPLLRIYYSKNGDLKKEMHYKNDQLFPYALLNKNSTRDQLMNITSNYWRICSTERYIYALYSGKKRNEIYKELHNPLSGISDFSNEIHVWDWEGKPQRRIFIDKRIYSFAVSNNDKYIIATSFENSTLIKIDI